MSSSERPRSRHTNFRENFSPVGSSSVVTSLGFQQASLDGDLAADPPGQRGSRQSNHADHIIGSNHEHDGTRSRLPSPHQHPWLTDSNTRQPDHSTTATTTTGGTHPDLYARNYQENGRNRHDSRNSLNNSLHLIRQAHYGHKFGIVILAFVRLGGQFISSIGLAFMFFEIKIEYFRVPWFAESGTSRVWDELYPQDRDGTNRWTDNMLTVMWSTWGLCWLTMLYSLLVYSMFLWHCLGKRRRGWFSPWYLIADMTMFGLWCALSTLMLKFVFRPLDDR